MSLICSYVLIREVLVDLKSNRARMSKPLSRALLAMSIADIFFSIPWFLTTWPAPAELDYIVWNVGNTATCTFQGVFFQFGLAASPLFSMTLSFFSLLMVRYQWTDHHFAKIESWIHAAIWTCAAALAIFPIPLNSYNNGINLCWIESYPYGCKDSATYGDEADCTRGDNAWIYALTLSLFPNWACMILSAIILLLIYLSVRDIETHIARYAGSIRSTNFSRRAAAGEAPSRTPACSTTVLGSTPALEDPELHIIRRERSHAVAKQAMWYTGAFLLTFSLDAVNSVFLYADDTYIPGLDLFAYMLFPLQGFFNFIVFSRTRRDMRTPEGRWLRGIVCCYERPKDQTRGAATTTVNSSVNHI